MALLAAANYDPTGGAAITASTAALLAMTAFDTTNLRVTFTVPPNGAVMVRLRVAQKGAATNPQTLLGVLQGSTIMVRAVPDVLVRSVGSATLTPHDLVAVVTGLTPGASLTWDAAYGVEVLVAATTFGWGGPNDAITTNAYGPAIFEVWSAPNLLAAANYDPASAVSKATSALQAMTALDTTNLRLSVPVPTSGKVLVRLRCMIEGGTVFPSIMLGVLEGATLRGRAAPMGGTNQQGTLATTDRSVAEVIYGITGLTAGTVNWDAAWGVESVVASTNIKYGGPNNNTTSDDGFGAFQFEVWDAT